jgi:hypothetical protein
MRGLVEGDRAIVTAIADFDIFKDSRRIWSKTSWMPEMEIFTKQSSIVYKVTTEEYVLYMDGKLYWFPKQYVKSANPVLLLTIGDVFSTKIEISPALYTKICTEKHHITLKPMTYV